MKNRPLGRTGLQIGEIGIGTWGFGGDLWRDVDPRDAQATLRLALDAGVTFIDTALAYGKGQAEALIGEAIRDARARDLAVIATKVPPTSSLKPAAPGTKLSELFPPEHVRESVESSLRNLRAEVIHLAQLHVWRDEWLDEPAWVPLEAMLRDLVRQGKVLHWGVSANAHEAGNAVRAAAEPVFETVQVIYNIFDISAREALFPTCTEHGVGIIVRCPFDEGALTGTVTPDSTFPKGDFRRWYFRDDRPTELAPRLAALRELVGDYADSLADLALRFALAPAEVSTVIPGMRRPEHLLANLRASEGQALPASIQDQLAELAWDKNWYQ